MLKADAGCAARAQHARSARDRAYVALCTAAKPPRQRMQAELVRTERARKRKKAEDGRDGNGRYVSGADEGVYAYPLSVVTPITRHTMHYRSTVEACAATYHNNKTTEHGRAALSNGSTRAAGSDRGWL